MEMDFKACLLLALRENKVTDISNLSEFVDKLLLQEENKDMPLASSSSATIDSTFAKIPKFYHSLPKSTESLAQKLREESRALFLQKKGLKLLDNSELKELWGHLEKRYTVVNDEQVITYDDYRQIQEAVPDKIRYHLTASAFARLQSISRHPGKISILALFNYIMRKVWLDQTRIGLSLYDYTGNGFLRETDFESYILELIPTLPQLEGLERSFYSFYVCTAVRKFFFFLDPYRTGRIRIRDILSCNFLDDLLELRDEETPKDAQEMNWFSAPAALSVYGHYLNLDKDHNGMLSKTELADYGSGTLTTIFLDRVFEECLTYDGEMDYKTYLDFVLALEHRKEPQSLHYFFKILDIEHKGYLTAYSLNYFFKGIQQQIEEHKAEFVTFHDIKDEIFDMVKPADPLKITLKDLINCGRGDTIVSILIEFDKFWSYEIREAIAIETNTEEASNQKAAPVATK